MRNFFDIPGIDRRFEMYSPSTVYEIHTGGHRSSTPVLSRRNGEWIVYLTGEKLSEVSSQNEYLSALNSYFNQ